MREILRWNKNGWPVQFQRKKERVDANIFLVLPWSKNTNMCQLNQTVEIEMINTTQIQIYCYSKGITGLGYSYPNQQFKIFHAQISRKKVSVLEFWQRSTADIGITGSWNNSRFISNNNLSMNFAIWSGYEEVELIGKNYEVVEERMFSSDSAALWFSCWDLRQAGKHPGCSL